MLKTIQKNGKNIMHIKIGLVFKTEKNILKNVKEVCEKNNNYNFYFFILK